MQIGVQNEMTDGHKIELTGGHKKLDYQDMGHKFDPEQDDGLSQKMAQKLGDLVAGTASRDTSVQVSLGRGTWSTVLDIWQACCVG